MFLISIFFLCIMGYAFYMCSIVLAVYLGVIILKYALVWICALIEAIKYSKEKKKD